MKTLKLEIDGRPCEAQEGDTVLQVARAAGIEIPTLCENKELSLYGGCRLCMVEVTRGKRTRMVASCVYPAEDGIKVSTDSEKVRKVRRVILELLLPLSDTGPLRELAAKYGLEKSRFSGKPTDCVLCGLCVRYCAEKKKAHAVYFQHRGVDRTLVKVDPKSGICIGCKQCFQLCPSGLIVEMAEEAYK